MWQLPAIHRGILKLEPGPSFPEYVEFDIGGGGLALFDARGQEELAPGSAKAGQNRCSMIEIEVDDVDRDTRGWERW